MSIQKNAFVVLTLLSFVIGGCTSSGQSVPALDTSVLSSQEIAAVKTPESPPSIRPAKPVTSKFSGKPYHSIISKYAAANGVPVDLAHAVVFSESSYKAGSTGAAGEIGLMQLRLPTARLVGYKGSAKGLYNPETNIKYGMKYLGRARELAGGSTCGTILRYNAGHGAKRMNPISQRYCNKVRKLLSA